MNGKKAKQLRKKALETTKEPEGIELLHKKMVRLMEGSKQVGIAMLFTKKHTGMIRTYRDFKKQYACAE